MKIRELKDSMKQQQELSNRLKDLESKNSYTRYKQVLNANENNGRAGNR